MAKGRLKAYFHPVGMRNINPMNTHNNIMKHQAITFTILCVAAFAIGCDNNKTSAPPLDKAPTASQQIDKTKSDIKEAAQDMKDYTFAQKAEFAQKMKTQLAEINKDMDDLQAKIDKSKDEVKAEANPKLQALRDQAAQLNKQLDAINDATESTWDSVKSTSKKAYESLKEGFQQSRQWLSEKIAP
jgi:predicted  nucleic acid-binding Zn-ribbon protein